MPIQGVDVSPIASLLGGMGAQRREDERKQDLTDLLTQAQGGDQNALNTLLVNNPQLGGMVQGRQDQEQAQVAQHRKVMRAKGLSHLASIPTIEARQAELRRMAQDGEIDPETANTMAGVINRPIEQQNKMIYDDLMVSGFKDLVPKPERLEQASGKGMEGYSFNPETGQFSISEELNNRIKKDVELDIKDSKSINDAVTKLTAPAVAIRSAATALVGLKKNSTPTDQLAAVFKFMKALDPTSSVRESEQGQVYSAEGAAAGMAAQLNKLLGEGGIATGNFENIVNTAKGLADSAIDTAETEVDGYLNAFGDSVGTAQGKRFRNRVPKRFVKNKVKGNLTAEQQSRKQQLEARINAAK